MKGLPTAAAQALAGLGPFGIHLGLDHVRRLLGALGDPHLAHPTVLVAGTNGKGSTAATLAAMVTAAGYRTGLSTSPHLEKATERVRLEGRPVSGKRLGDAILRVVETARDLQERGVLEEPPTYFEALTAAGALVFASTPLDLVILEVGIGGRLDATNAADPILSIITTVALDHQALLGDTLTAVAGEKAGILRAGRPAVAWGGVEEVRRALRRAADDLGANDRGADHRGADLRFAEDEVTVESLEAREPVPWGGLRLRLRTPRRSYDLETPLAGRHQAQNLALAVRAAERLEEASAGALTVPAEAIEAGAATVVWPGRLESVNVDLEGAALRVILDGAHNPAGATALGSALDEAAAVGGSPPVLVFGVVADKDAPRMLPALAQRAAYVILTRPPNERGRDPGELRSLLTSESPPHRVLPGASEAMAHALETAVTRGRVPVVVCGSLFLVGEARDWLRQRFGVPAA